MQGKNDKDSKMTQIMKRKHIHRLPNYTCAMPLHMRMSVFGSNTPTIDTKKHRHTIFNIFMHARTFIKC